MVCRPGWETGATVRKFIAADLLVTPKQAERRLGVPARTVRYLMDAGKLPVERVGPAGKAWRRVRLRDVQRLLHQ